MWQQLRFAHRHCVRHRHLSHHLTPPTQIQMCSLVGMVATERSSMETIFTVIRKSSTVYPGNLSYVFRVSDIRLGPTQVPCWSKESSRPNPCWPQPWCFWARLPSKPQIKQGWNSGPGRLLDVLWRIVSRLRGMGCAVFGLSVLFFLNIHPFFREKNPAEHLWPREAISHPWIHFDGQDWCA